MTGVRGNAFWQREGIMNIKLCWNVHPRLAGLAGRQNGGATA